MSKVLTIIASLIVLTIAVEAGYFWGLKRSASFPTPQINITEQQPTELPPTPFPTPFPASMIPSLLSYQAAIAVGQNAVDREVWQSDWVIGQGGNLISLTENSVTLDYFDAGRRNFVFPAGIQVIYSKWSQLTQQSSPAAPAEFTVGDNVGIMFTIDTTSGSFKRVEISKTVD